MGSALILHNKIIRKLLDQYHGYEVKTQGDSFMVAFQQPYDALKWCLSVQSALLKAPWDSHLLAHPDSAELFSLGGVLEKRGLRVRMGIHMGTPNSVSTDPTTGRTDYFGQMVNKAARVSGLASGGQIIISDSVHRAILAFTKKIPVDFHYLGSFKLKGIDQDEALYEAIPVY